MPLRKAAQVPGNTGRHHDVIIGHRLGNGELSAHAPGRPCALCSGAQASARRPGRHRRSPTRRGKVTRFFRDIAVPASAIMVPLMALVALVGGGTAAAAAATSTGVSWHRLSLINGWRSSAAAGTGNPRWAVKGGVVYLSGSLYQQTGTKQDAARLPRAARPSRTLFITVYTNGSTTGDLEIFPDGIIAVHGVAGNARAYTSLASVSYPASSMSAHKLTLKYGWKSSQHADGTGDPGYNISGGVVYLSGSLHQPSGSDQIFTVLPKAARPTHILYVAMYTKGGTTGELIIDPDGAIQAYGADSRSFTSLAGVSFPAAKIIRHKLALLPGWTSEKAALQTGDPSYSIVGGVVYLSGAMVRALGTGDEFAVLPPGARPAHTLYVKAWMSAFAVGTVQIRPDGTMLAYEVPAADNPVSLESISFPVTS